MAGRVIVKGSFTNVSASARFTSALAASIASSPIADTKGRYYAVAGGEILSQPVQGTFDTATLTWTVAVVPVAGVIYRISAPGFMPDCFVESSAYLPMPAGGADVVVNAETLVGEPGGDTLVEYVTLTTVIASIDSKVATAVDEYFVAHPPTVVTDHGDLTGLDEDAHPQYLTVARGDTRYVQPGALDKALTPVRGGTVLAAPTWGARVATTTIGVGVLADGLLYGATGTVLKSSADAGRTWSTVRDLGGSDEIVRIMDTSGGEVLIVRNYAIYRTTGWAANKATATVTNVRAVSGESSFYPWGVDANPATGLCVATTYAGSPPYNDARYLWKSTDGGVTWAVVYDLADHVTEVGVGTDTLATAHMHIAAIDPWAEDRIWASWHGSTIPSGVVMWSDDGGATWSKLPTSLHPTVGVATKYGMAWGSDDLPQGVYTTPRTEDPSDQVFKFAWRWPASADGQVGWGHWGTRTPDGETAFIAFISDINDPPVVAQSDGVTASMMLQGPVNTSIRTDGYRGVHYINGELLAFDRRNGGWLVERGVHNLTRIPATDPDADPGWVLGGSATGARSLSAGLNSAATGAKSIAIGTEATSNQLAAIAIGDGATVSGSAAVSVGADAVAGVRSIAVGESVNAEGPDATAIGQSASTSGQYPTAIGAQAAVTASYGTAIGYTASAGHSSVSVGSNASAPNSSVSVGRNSNANADLSVAVGHGAVGGGAYGTVVGQGALIEGTTQRGTAIGQGSKVASGHSSSVALGSLTTTTALGQVQVGAKHIELQHLSAPDAGPAGSARLFTRTLAGKQELCVRFPDGSIVVIASTP